jgi:hypothetical protein
MRLTLIRDDNLIVKDGIGYFADLSEFDNLDWIPGYELKSWGRFHALQWYGDPDEDGEYGFGKDFPHGEIEFKKTVPNFIIDQLGVYERAIILWEESKLAEEERIRQEEAEALRLREEEEAALREAYLDFDIEAILADI